MSEDKKVTGFAGLSNLTSDNEKKQSALTAENLQNKGTVKSSQKIVASASERNRTDVQSATGFSGLGSLTSDNAGTAQTASDKTAIQTSSSVSPDSSSSNTVGTGFAGLSNHTSDSSDTSQISTTVKPTPTEPNKPEISQISVDSKSFEPIQVLDHASMPTPWSSVDDGETWEWGEYLLALQKEPESMAVSVAKSQGVTPSEQGLFYPFVMSVFKKSGPSKLPILVYTIEQVNIRVVAKNFGSAMAEEMRSAPGSNLGKAKFCRFVGSGRDNFGNYSGGMDKDSVRRFLLDQIRKELNLHGGPQFIGTFRDYLGNQENSKKESSENKSSDKQESQQPKSVSSTTGTKTDGGGRKWIFIVIGALIVLGLILFFATRSGGSKNETKQPVSSGSVTEQDNSSSDGGKYLKPPVNARRPLTTSEVRWCLRTKGDLMNSLEKRESKDMNVRKSFNELASDYNARCGNYQADSKDIEQAERDTGIKR